MLYPKNIEQKVGFDKIRDLLLENCSSNLGRAFVDKIRFSDNYDQVKKLIGQTAEFKLILQTDSSSFPNQNYLDVSESLSRAEIQGSYLDTEDFFDLKLSLVTIIQIVRFFEKKEDWQYPLLREVVAGTAQIVEEISSLTAQIDRIIDERGQVRDNASPDLAEIRKKLTMEQNAVRRTLDRIYKMAKNSGWIGDEMSITVRNGRLVIPLLAEHKRKLKGFVHDESATGQMAFVEPGEVLEANNEIRDLEIRERREIIRILEKLTSTIRPMVPELRKAYFMLGIMDFIRAKANFALKIEATSPLLVEDRTLEWNNAKHPILYLAHEKMGKPTIPLKVTLDSEKRILIVSGPNAGGKSVMLKTIGLIQYMAQCGLLVPVSPDSKIGIFKNIFIDIGDEQSIENDLSTYSSHLTNMNYFINHANRFSLFLIDEFGTGTEPNLGGAIAESILEHLVKSKALGVINTHYTNLKIFADKNPGLVNGAMKFDAAELEPLYELEMGKPGSSFALEVAQKIGLPEHLIRNAKRKLGTQQVDFEKMLKELEIEKKVFSEKNREFSLNTRELKERMEQYNGLKDFLDSEQKRIINEAKSQAKELLKEANKKIEKTIREIKESAAEKTVTQKAREELEVFDKKELIPQTPKKIIIKVPEEWEKSEKDISIGSFVRIKGQETIGEVVALRDKDAELAIGQLKTNVKLNRLEAVSKKEMKAAQKSAVKVAMSGIDMNEKMANFSFNLDIRGKRGEEAIIDLDNLIDDAIMLGYPEIRIVHGKGDGILRNLVRTHLKNYKQVGRMEDEHADRGGHGVTIVKMN